MNQHHYLENVTMALNAMKKDDIKLVNIGMFATLPFRSFLAQLISCAITNHYLWRDCCCRRHRHLHLHRHQHCRQKLTSSSVPI